MAAGPQAEQEGKVKSSKWYKIKAKEDSAEISIFGDIGASWFGDSVTAADFKKDFDAVKDKASIHILINSPGGDVFDGIAIYNIIATEREKVSVEVMALAASAASIIALAGSSLTIDTAGFFMIHNPWSWAMGGADDMRETADLLDKIGGELVNIYEAHSDLSADEIQEYMDADTWFTADEAVEAGFADEQIEHEAVAASVSVDSRYAYKHVPERFQGSAEGNKKPATIRDFEAYLRDSGFSKKESVAIAAHGFETDQGEPEPEESQGDPVDAVDEAERPANVALENKRVERKILNKGVGQ